MALLDDADIAAIRDEPSVETLAKVSALTIDAGTMAVAALGVAAPAIAALKVPPPGVAIWTTEPQRVVERRRCGFVRVFVWRR